MSTLIKRTDGSWQISNAHAVMQWRAADVWQPGEALLLATDAEVDPRFTEAKAIAIDFPAFTDGRGLSLAVLLRTRLSYDGELRATGAIHEDVLHYMVRCGFDTLELPDGRDAEAALALLSPYSSLYQGCVQQPEPAFKRVQRGV